MQLALKHKNNLAALGNLRDVTLEQGTSVGAIWTVYSLAKKLGIAEALGHDFQGQLAMPESLSHKEVSVVTRKNLPSRQRQA